MKYHMIWKEQCKAAHGIREDFGTDKALDYLIGEKFVNFLDAAETNENFKSQVSAFVEGILKVFDPCEIRDYFEVLEGAPDDVRSRLDNLTIQEKEDHLLFENPVAGAERLLRIQYARELFLR